MIVLKDIIGKCLINFYTHVYFFHIHLDFQTAYQMNCFNSWCNLRCYWCKCGKCGNGVFNPDVIQYINEGGVGEHLLSCESFNARLFL